MSPFKTTPVDMAQIIRHFLPLYRQHYKLSPQQASVCQSIVQCQSELLGGDYTQCTACGYEQIHYHSCGNRHCPKCKQKASEQWEEKQLEALLPVTYYHLVFTLPHELNTWCQLHPKILYALFFKAVWQTLLQFSRTHKRLQGQLGVTCVLHTWGQNLQQHVHLHCLIPGVALKAGNRAIETTKSDYLYPVNALKKVFRGKMVSLLREAYQQNRLFRIKQANEVKGVLDELMNKPWCVYIKPYIRNPQTVVKYLSRYTYRIAISHYRIVKMDKQSVYFYWKDYTDNSRRKVMKLDGVEFIRRFLLHVFPNGLMRIRHFGFLANCVRKKYVARLRELLKRVGAVVKPIKTVKPTTEAQDSGCFCPRCQSNTMKRLYRIASLKHQRPIMS